jgi:Ca2+-binding RTX toxin-like protein
MSRLHRSLYGRVLAGEGNVAQVNGTEAGEYLAGTDGDDIIYGFGGADQINGMGGNDIIYPGAGRDLVQAGYGNDTIILANPLEYLDFFPMGAYEEFAGNDGFDTLEMHNFDDAANNTTTAYGLVSSYTFSSWYSSITTMERLSFASSESVGILATLQHVQVGTSGITELVGGAGRDIFEIYATYSADFTMPQFTFSNWQSAPVDLTSGDVISLVGMAFVGTTNNYTLIAREGLGATQALFGADGTDTLRGSSSADLLDGGVGDDTLIGNGGADRMVGGAGNDVYFAATGTTIVEAVGQGNDRVIAISNLMLAADADIETLETASYTDTAAINLTGSNTANTILGNNGANVFDGGAGDDTIHGFAGNDYLYGATGLDNMYGGAGDDAYYMATNDGDRVWEFAGEGYDVVSTEVDYTLPDTSGSV